MDKLPPLGLESVYVVLSLSSYLRLWTMAAPRRLDILALQVLRSDTVAVDEYRYLMHGVHTGQLFLMRASTSYVAWRSTATGLTTAWHGRWYVTGDNTHFDCKGRKLDYKWARLTRSLDGNLHGVDYRGRAILAELVRTWHI